MAANPSIQLGTDGNWAIKEDNLLAYKKDGTRFFNKEFNFTRGSLATFVDKDGLIKYSGVTDTELVVNGNFSDGTNSWTPNTNATLSIDNGKLKVAISGAASGYPSQNITTVVGRKYKITADAFIGTATKVSLYSAAFGFNDLTTDGSYNFTFTATSTSTQIRLYVYGNESYGFWDNVSVKEIQTDVPRIDFTDDATGHLLLEPQSTNTVRYSEDFSNAEWGQVGSPTLTGGQLAPDGTLTATKISGTIGSSNIALGTSSSTTATRTIYAKTVSGTGTAKLMSYYGNTNNLFTLTEEWQRFELTGSISTGGPTFYIDFRDNSQTLSEFIIWGAQSEELTYATSYIPTNGSTATRNAEVCNNSGSAQDFNSEEGVLYAEVARFGSDTSFASISISDGSVSNVIAFKFRNLANQVAGRVAGASTSKDITVTTSDISQFNKFAISYSTTSDISKFYINGVEVGTISLAGLTVSGLATLQFNRGSSGGEEFSGKVRNVQVFKRALSDGELYLLTVPQYQSYQEMATALNYTL